MNLQQICDIYSILYCPSGASLPTSICCDGGCIALTNDAVSTHSPVCPYKVPARHKAHASILRPVTDYTIVQIFRAAHWYIGPTAIPREAEQNHAIVIIITNCSHNVSLFYKLFTYKGHWFNPKYCLLVTVVSIGTLSLAYRSEKDTHQTMVVIWCAHPIRGWHF